MLAKKIPFFTVLLAGVLPAFVAMTNSKTLAAIPDAGCLLMFSFFLLTTKRAREFTISTIIVSVVILMLLMLAFTFHVSVGSFGTLSIFVLTVVFFKLLTLDSTLNPSELYKHLATIYKLHFIFIALELFLIVFGYQSLLMNLFSGSAFDEPIVKVYKDYNSAKLLRVLLDTDSVSGANSLLIGSQAASQLILIGTLFFGPFIQTKNAQPLNKKTTSWFLFGLLIYPFVATMTANVIFLAFVFLLLFFIPNSRFNQPLSRFISIGLIALASPILIPLLAFRIHNAEDITVYWDHFIAPVLTLIESDYKEVIFGFGRHVNNSGVTDADFGFGMLILQLGSLLFIVFMSLITLLIFSTNKLLRSSKDNTSNVTRWKQLSAINIICAVGWLTSLIHYTTALELGGRHIFAFHLACVLVCNSELKKLRNQHQGIIGTNQFDRTC